MNGNVRHYKSLNLTSIHYLQKSIVYEDINLCGFDKLGLTNKLIIRNLHANHVRINSCNFYFSIELLSCNIGHLVIDDTRYIQLSPRDCKIFQVYKKDGLENLSVRKNTRCIYNISDISNFNTDIHMSDKSRLYMQGWSI